MTKEGSKISRRKMIKGAAAAGLGGSFLPFTGLADTGQKRKGGLIEQENSKPGTYEWQLQFTAFDTPVTMASYPMVRYLRLSLIHI